MHHRHENLLQGGGKNCIEMRENLKEEINVSFMIFELQANSLKIIFNCQFLNDFLYA